MNQTATQLLSLKDNPHVNAVSDLLVKGLSARFTKAYLNEVREDLIKYYVDGYSPMDKAAHLVAGTSDPVWTLITMLTEAISKAPSNKLATAA